jgi:F-type H+-transporting ATPase subunit b
MASFIGQFAAEGSSDIMTGLGIDGKLLAFQLIAFLLLVFVLAKWVFPIFFKIIDKRQEAIEESNRAAVEASKHAEKAQEEITKLLKEARTEAKEIVNTAKEEATAMVQDAESKGKAQAEHIVAEAHDEIAKEVIAAKKALHNETIDLVASATEKVIGKTVTDGVDGKVIKAALEESK